MRVLILDTALDACQAVVGDHAGLGAIERREPARGQAEAIVALADAVLRRAGWSYSDLDRIAVVAGPGSFTGLRVGVAAARGIALVAECELVGLSSLLGLAASVPDRGERGAPIVAAIDARHDAVYGQMFSADLEPLADARHVAIADLVGDIPAGARIVGSGAEPIAADLVAKGKPAGEILALPAAAPEALLALALNAEATATPPRPIYLKAPDARPSGPVLVKSA
ncbi:tRNA (adenosine(37)-N6)-threonylcarbamoyltransferase complex dimerization subunit type 1 TsaB [Amorphus sp. 3PC139-8]|uniref:tRNA (adenosine(37)-N6)-threonylcarbamoyltransferase complex dimerization subunit type 1 TsaB n=1 Tax=Amorphus sp. 3PC139-8 TaxID=2735676 RepID=UPI00345D99B2